MTAAGRRLSLGILVPMLAGAAFLAGAAILAVPPLRFVATAARAPAVFAGSEARPGGPHGGSFNHATFRFRTPDGRAVSVVSRFGSTDQPYAEGDRVTVLYDPRQPDHAAIDTVAQLWLAPLVLAAVGAGLAGIPAIVLLAGRRRPG